MQKHPYLIAAASAALLALGACNSEPEVVSTRTDSQAEALQNAAPVQLPPSITHSRTFRCTDNSLVYVDFYNNNTAQIRTTQDGMPTMLSAAEGNPPYTADGYSVSANAATVRITAPGKNNLSCRT